jgi:hypothetical protein
MFDKILSRAVGGWALELFDRIRQLNYDVRKPIGCAVLYEDDPNFNTFNFYQLNYVQRDKLTKSEINYCQNACDEAKKMICNWIEEKTVGSHNYFVIISRWTALMVWLLGYRIWFDFSYLSANHDLVDSFSRIDPLKLLGNVP